MAVQTGNFIDSMIVSELDQKLGTSLKSSLYNYKPHRSSQSQPPRPARKKWHMRVEQRVARRRAEDMSEREREQRGIAVRTLDGECSSVSISPNCTIKDLKSILKESFPPAHRYPNFHLFFKVTICNPIKGNRPLDFIDPWNDHSLHYLLPKPMIKWFAFSVQR